MYHEFSKQMLDPQHALASLGWDTCFLQSVSNIEIFLFLSFFLLLIKLKPHKTEEYQVKFNSAYAPSAYWDVLNFRLQFIFFYKGRKMYLDGREKSRASDLVCRTSWWKFIWKSNSEFHVNFNNAEDAFLKNKVLSLIKHEFLIWIWIWFHFWALLSFSFLFV